MKNKIAVISLGCPKNLVDSDNLTRKLISSGFSFLDNPEDADILLINTCGFIEDAKKESIEEILKLVKLKVSRGQGIKGSSENLETSEPRNLGTYPKLIVFGCLAKRYKDELIKEIPEMDAIFGVAEEEKIVEYCKEIQGLKGQRVKGSEFQSAHSPIHRFTHSPIHPFTSYAYLKISEGCNKRCAYCVIPSIRGNYRSAPPDEIMKEAERLLKAGVKELILVAQDTACYGKDFNPPGANNISSLLKGLCSISGDFWIRLLYTYPDSINEALLNVIAGEDKICKYLDIPLQHSEERILRLMGRKGTRKEYLNLIRAIRSTIPDIALRTTFIAGFPSETEKEFNSLIDFIEKTRFDRLGAFKYSKEEGTPAAKLKGQLTEAVKNKRLDKIMQCQSRISLEKNKKLIGKKFKALIDEINNGVAVGRLYSHAPEIDGVVIIDDSPIHPFTHSPIKAGDFVTLEITDAYDYDLKGKIVK